MSYLWLRYLHLGAAIIFVGVHGASMVVFYVIRGEKDRGRIQDLLGFSAKTVIPMYISIGLVVVTGILVGQEIGAFERGWGWWSLVLLAVVTILMFFIAKPIHRRIHDACEYRPSGKPRVSDEELGLILRSPQVHLVSAIGVAGVAALVYLMTFKPF